MVLRKITDYLGTPLPGTPGTSAPGPAPTPTPASDAARVPGRALVSTPTPVPAAPGTSAAIPTATPPWDGTAALSAELNDLTATLDMLTTVVASLSNRVDSQVDGLNKLTTTAAETRQAAFHAKAQTDPTLFQDAINAATRDTLHRLGTIASALTTEQEEARQADQAIQKELTTLKSALLVVLQTDQRQQKRRKRQLPVLSFCAVLLVLALALLAPRLAGLHPGVCVALGAEPVDYGGYGTGYDACTINLR